MSEFDGVEKKSKWEKINNRKMFIWISIELGSEKL